MWTVWPKCHHAGHDCNMAFNEIHSFLIKREKCREWHQQNSKADSSRLPSLHRNIYVYILQKLSELCQNSGKQSKVHSNQINAQSRKRQLTNTARNLCGDFTCPYLTPFLAAGQQTSWTWQPPFPVWDPSPWFQRKQSRPYSQITVSVLTSLGAT